MNYDLRESFSLFDVFDSFDYLQFKKTKSIAHFKSE